MTNLKILNLHTTKINLSDGSYSIAQIQYYFEYIIEKHKPMTDNPLIQISVNRIKIMIVFMQ